jgi:hypothetical protein
MPFVANGLVEIGSGLASALILFWYQWWAPLEELMARRGTYADLYAIQASGYR